MKLTDTACRNAKPKAKPYKLFDGGGLYLEVRGRRDWLPVPTKGRAAQ